MLETLCSKLGAFLLGHISIIVALIIAAKWFSSRRLSAPKVAGMATNPLESDLYLDTVAALRSLGVTKGAATKKVEDVMRQHSGVSDPKELLKLCYQTGG